MSAPARKPIRRLSAETVQRIAAGEVVERPASVVKELVENSVDAGAHEVRVRLEQAGLESIEVSDDGGGIPSGELELAVERHATNKIDDGAALESIGTLGFRGEALASIGAVARIRIVSRPADSEEAHGLSVVAGQMVGTFVAGRPIGTTVGVRELFFNTPARRKFLRSPASELVEVTSTIERLYLARPDVGLALESDGREVARFPPERTLVEAATQVFGPEFLDQSFEVEANANEGVQLRGVVGLPSINRSTSQGIFLSVNGRTIASRVLAQAVRQAFADHLPKSRFPVGVVQIRIEPSRVDVNVHPTKREIRIARERELADLLRRAVRESLLARARSGAPKASRHRAGGTGSRPLPVASSVLIEPLPVSGPVPGRARADDGGVQQTLLPEGPSIRVEPTPRHGALRLLGPVFSLYWVAEGDDGLVLIDQHAASERLLYEALRRDGRLARQELVEPVSVLLTARQREVLRERQDEVGHSGFEVEPFGKEVYRILSVPVYRGHRARHDSFAAMLDELADGGRPTVPNGLEERTAATIACHAAVRAGDRIEGTEMLRILEGLRGLPEPPYACPHGRPIQLSLPRGRLDRWFLRSGP